MRVYVVGLLRPWKIVTFLAGMGFFIWGVDYWAVPTWDVGVSIIMSVLCFALAPFAMDLVVDVIKRRAKRPARNVFIAMVVIYTVASGSYELYNTVRMGQHPITYWWNLAFSVPATVAAGLVWRFEGSLADLGKGIAELFRGDQS